MMVKYQDEIGVTMVPFKLMVFVPADGKYEPIDELAEGTEFLSISGTELRDKLAAGDEIPEWFTYPEVVEELRKTSKPRRQQGYTVFFTGLSGSGKSTVANALMVKLLEQGGRTVTLLDGDVVRKNLSKGLTFSKEDRDTNVMRIGYVASEITKAGGTAICAPIAPYESARSVNRATISEYGGYILVHVSTPLEVCESRDRKGLYAKARAGIIPEFTGISDPYEVPEDAEIVLDTSHIDVEEAAQVVYDYLVEHGYISG
jgi:sulfate adenylyltransferase